jgi:hypothetical protein
MLLYGIAVWIVAVPARRRYLDRELWFRPIISAPFAALAAATMLAQTLNASGMLFEPNAAWYFFGVLFLLLASCLLLMRIVFVRPRSQ